MTKYEAPSTDDRRIWDLWLTGTYQSAIVAADDAGIFAALAEEPATIDGLAQRLDFDVRATGILLRLLGALDLVVPRDGVFQLTDQARLYLVKSSPFYWGNMMRVRVSEWHRDTVLAKLKEKGSADAAGPEGGRATKRLEGTRGRLGRRQDRNRRGNRDRGRHAFAFVAGRDRRRAQLRLHGHRAHSRRRRRIGLLHDCIRASASASSRPRSWSSVRCARSRRRTSRAGGVAAQRRYRGSRHVSRAVAEGLRRLFFSNIWHDWNVRTCAWLAERAYEVLPSGGRIMLHEMLLDDDGAGPATTAAFSMLMLLATQGQQFTFARDQGPSRESGLRGYPDAANGRLLLDHHGLQALDDVRPQHCCPLKSASGRVPARASRSGGLVPAVGRRRVRLRDARSSLRARPAYISMP